MEWISKAHIGSHITIVRRGETITGILAGMSVAQIDITRIGGSTEYAPGWPTLTLAPWYTNITIGPGDAVTITNN